MKLTLKQTVSLVLVIVLAMSCMTGTFASDPEQLDAVLQDTGNYIYKTVKKPQVGSVGGEWAIMGLARAGCDVLEKYYQDYYDTVEKYVVACGGVLHKKKYTEYSRLTVALSSIGRDPRDVAGYNLLTPLGDFDKTIWQGINGPIWALIALDSGNYPMPKNFGAKTQATRDMYVDEILRRQLDDGGFSLFGGTDYATASDEISDPDITAMALQALSKYQHRSDVKKVTQEALTCLSDLQNSKGGFASWGTDNSESCAQVIVALTELGIPLEDSRFVKQENTLIDNLLNFYKKGQGFLHTANGSGSNQMATEQAFYALVSVKRAKDEKNSLYRMGDAILIPDGVYEGSKAGEGLSGKHSDIKVAPIMNHSKTFQDICSHANQPAIAALATRGIINGKTDTTFDPDATMTRAEFAAVIVRGLGLPEITESVFVDIPSDRWYAGYVGAAYHYGIIKGISSTNFNPEGTISREEAAVMVARAAKLCGMDTSLTGVGVRDILAQFVDYITTSSWSRSSLAFCYREDILSMEDLDIRPKTAIKRCEVAEMLFNMLRAANLI